MTGAEGRGFNPLRHPGALTSFKLKHVSMYCTSMYTLELCTARNKVSYPYLQNVSFHNENALFTEILKIRKLPFKMKRYKNF